MLVLKDWKDYSEDELYLIYQESKSLTDFANKIGVGSHRIPVIRKTYPWLQDKRKKIKINAKFGKLTIIEILSSTKVKCRCDCGNIIEVYKSNLSKGYTRSCGCLRKETAKQHAIDLNTFRAQQFLQDTIGKTYGQLTALEKDEEKSQEMGKVYIKCKCNCGCNSIVSIRIDSLKDGTTTSCGATKSRGELKIKQVLNKMNINYSQQVHFKDLKNKGFLYFDFGIYDENNNLLTLIEFQGQQHYYMPDCWGGEETLIESQKRDQLKREYCLQNNIPLVEIPYQDLKRIDEDYIKKIIKKK